MSDESLFKPDIIARALKAVRTELEPKTVERCDACGVLWHQHDGIAKTCDELHKARQRVERLEGAGREALKALEELNASIGCRDGEWHAVKALRSALAGEGVGK